MILNKETHTRKSSGGVRESTLQKLQRLEDKCSPSIEKGGVKLDSWHCDRS